MTEVTVIVKLEFDDGRSVVATEENVRLGDDPVQISAAGLAYGLVEDAWALVDLDD